MSRPTRPAALRVNAAAARFPLADKLPLADKEVPDDRPRGPLAPKTALTAEAGLPGATVGDSRRYRLSRPVLLALTTAHIALSVGLLGDSAGFLAVAARRAASTDGAFREATRELLAMFAVTFGIPLSVAALLTGIALALGTKWRLFRYPWVIAKLGLTLSVVVVGATVIRPVLDPLPDPDDIALLAGAAWDVAALLAAVVLSVYKPGRWSVRRR